MTVEYQHTPEELDVIGSERQKSLEVAVALEGADKVVNTVNNLPITQPAKDRLFQDIQQAQARIAQSDTLSQSLKRLAPAQENKTGFGSIGELKRAGLQAKAAEKKASLSQPIVTPQPAKTEPEPVQLEDRILATELPQPQFAMPSEPVNSPLTVPETAPDMVKKEANLRDLHKFANGLREETKQQLVSESTDKEKLLQVQQNNDEFKNRLTEFMPQKIDSTPKSLIEVQDEIKVFSQTNVIDNTLTDLEKYAMRGYQNQQMENRTYTEAALTNLAEAAKGLSLGTGEALFTVADMVSASQQIKDNIPQAIVGLATGEMDLGGAVNRVFKVDSKKTLGGVMDAVGRASVGVSLRPNFTETKQMYDEALVEPISYANTVSDEVSKEDASERQASVAAILKKVQSEKGKVEFMDEVVAQAKTIPDALEDIWDNPIELQSVLSESASSALAPAALTSAKIGALTRTMNPAEKTVFLNSKAGKKQIAAYAAKSGIHVGATMEAAGNSNEVFEEIRAMDVKELKNKSPEFNKLLDSDMSPEDAKNALAEAARMQAFTVSYAISAGSSRLFKTGELEGTGFGLLIGNNGTKLKDAVLDVLKSTSLELGQETIESVGGTVAKNIAKSNTVDPDQSIVEGTGDAAAMGAVAGAAMGGGMSTVANAKDIVKGTAGLTKEGVDYIFSTDEQKTDAKKSKLNEEIASKFDVTKPDEFADSTEYGFKDKIEALFSSENLRRDEVVEDNYKSTAATAIKVFDKEIKEINVLKNSLNEKILNKSITVAEVKAEKKVITEREKAINEVRSSYENRILTLMKTTKDKNTIKEELKNYVTQSFSDMDEQEVRNYAQLYRDLGSQAESFSDEEVKELQAIDPEAASIVEAIKTKVSFENKTGGEVNADLMTSKKKTGINSIHDTFENVRTGFVKGNNGLFRNSLNKLDELLVGRIKFRDSILAYKKRSTKQEESLAQVTEEIAALESYIKAGKAMDTAFTKGNIEAVVAEEVAKSTLNTDTVELLDVDEKGDVVNSELASDSVSLSQNNLLDADTKETGKIAYEVIQSMARFTAIDERYNKNPEGNEKSHKNALTEWEAAEQKLAAHLSSKGYTEEQVEDALDNPQSFLNGLVKGIKAEPSVQEETVSEETTVNEEDDSDWVEEGSIEEDTVTEEVVAEDREASEADIRKEVSDLALAINEMSDSKEDTVSGKLLDLTDHLVKRFSGKSFNEVRKSVTEYYNGIEDVFTNRVTKPNESKYYQAGRRFATKNGLMTFSFKALMAYRTAVGKPKVFSYRSKNLSAVLKNPNLLTQIENEISNGEDSYVFLKNFTPKEVEALGLSVTYLREIMSEINSFLSISYQGKDGQAQGKNMLKDNPILELTYQNENGEFVLDESVKLSIAVGILHMISEDEKVTNTANTERDINQILGRQSDHPVSYYEMQQLQDMGQKLGFMSEIAGETALEVVGLKVNSNPNFPALKDRLQLAMGAIGFRAMANLGYMEIVDYSTTKLIEMTQGKGFISQEDALISQKMTAKEGRNIEVKDSIKTKFVRVTAMGATKLNELRQTLGSENQLLTDVFGVSDDKVAKMPTREPVVASSTVKRNESVLGKEYQARIQLHNNQKHTVSATAALWNMLPDSVQARIAGVKSDKEMKGLHIFEKLKYKAANQGLMRELEFFKDFVTKGIEGIFYFSHSVSKNSRMDIPEKINVQASKIHRWLMVNERWKITVDSVFLRQMFKVKVAAAFNASIDTTKNKQLLDTFDSLLTNPIVQKAVQAYKNIEAGSQKQGDYNDLIAGVDFGENKVHTLAGIKALASYHPTEAFEEDLAMEVDGKTNGFMIGLLQMYGGFTDEQLKDLLKRGGISNDNENLSTLNILDSYQIIAKKWGETNEAFWNNPVIEEEEFLQDLKTELTNSISKKPETFKEAVNTILQPFVVDGGVTRFARGLAKSPLMVWNYNAGLKSMVIKFVNDVLEMEYKQLASMKREYYSDKTTNVRRQEIKNILAAKSKAYSVLTGLKQEITIDNADTFILEGKAEKNFIGTMGYINGNGISKGIEESFPALALNRKKYNYFVKHTFDVFGQTYNRLAEAYMTINNVKYVSREAHDTIMRLLGDVRIKMPVYLSDTSTKEGRYVDTSTWREFSDFDSVNKHDTQGNVVLDTKGAAKADTHIVLGFNKGLPVVDVNKSSVKTPKEMGLTPTFISFDVFKNSFTGVAPVITHSIDAHTMTGVFGEPVYNIHDAIVVGGSDIKDIVNKLNYSFYEVNHNYSMMEAAKHSAENLKYELTRFFDKLPKAKFNNDMKTVFGDKANLEQFHAAYSESFDIITKISKKGNEYSKYLIEELIDFEAVREGTDNPKKRVMGGIRYWNQYTMNYASYQNTQVNEPSHTIEQAVEEAIAEENKISEAEESRRPYISGLKMNMEVVVVSQRNGKNYTIKYTRNKNGNLFKHINNEDGSKLSVSVMDVNGKWVIKGTSVEALVFEKGTMSDAVHLDFAKFHNGYSELDGFDRMDSQTGVTFGNSAEALVNREDNFNNWFGDSKIVNEDGSPRVVYHGSPSSDITAFESEGSRKPLIYGYQQGIYFSPDPKYASDYARRNDNATVYPVYLKMENPLYVFGPEPATSGIKGILNRIKYGRSQMTDEKELNKFRSGEKTSFFITEEDKVILQRAGYDGIINEKYKEYIVFESSQVKSAVGNSGLFSESDPSILGSSAGGFGRFTAYRTETIDTVAAAEATIDELQNNDFTPTTAEHYQHLRGLLNRITTAVQPAVLMLGNAIDGTLGNYSEATQTIRIKLRGTPPSLLRGMSAAETFTHEMIHHVISPYLNKKNVYTDELRWLHEVAKKHVKPRDFLELDVNGNPPSKPTKAQMRAARETWKYVFQNTTSKTQVVTDPLTGMSETEIVHNGFHEFIAHATTNLQLMRILRDNKELNEEFRKGRKFKMKQSKAESGLIIKLGDFVAHMFETVMEYIHVLGNRVFKIQVKETKADETVILLLKNMMDTQQKANLAILAKIQKAEDNLNKKTKELITSAVQSNFTNGVSNALNKVASKNIPIASSIAGTAASGIRIVNNLSYTGKEGVSEYMDSIHSLFKMGEDTLIGQTFREIQGNNKRTGYVHKLKAIRSRFIDAMRQNTEANILTFINQDLFKGQLTEGQNKSMYYVIAKADLQSLGYELTDIETLLRNESKLKGKVKAIEKEIAAKFPNLQHYYTKHADSLGHYMATGKALEYLPYKNAYTIANVVNVPSKQNLVTDAVAAEVLINQLATLKALTYTGLDYKTTVADMIASNPSGIEASMELHKKTLQLALERNFDNNKMLTEKGYISDVTNPQHSLVFAHAHELAGYVAEGYKLVYQNPIKKDAYDNNTKEMYVLVNPFGSLNTLQGGAISTTNNRARGTNLVQVRNQNGKNIGIDPLTSYLDGLDDIAVYTNDIQPVVDAQFGSGSTAVEDNILFPSIDENGNIVNFRYQMWHETKVDALQLHDMFDQSLAYTVSHTKDKINTTVINRIAAKSLFDDFNKFSTKEMHDYVFIGKNSPEAKYRDLWYMLPFDARQELETYFGEEGLYIRKRNIDNFFGQREMRSKEIFLELNKRFHDPLTKAMAIIAGKSKFRKYEDAFLEGMGWIRDTIVIKFGTTAAINMFSNLILTTLKTGNLVTSFTKTAEGFKYANQYMNTLHNVEQLKLQLETKKNLTKSEIRNKMSDVMRLEEELQNNPIGYLIKQGVFQTVVEDLDSENEAYAFSTQLAKSLEQYTNKVPAIVRDVFKIGLMQHDTRLYKFMHKTTQLSDFAARYALFEHNKSEGMSNKDNIKDITDTFVDYGYATHPLIAALNKFNVLMFTKYTLRIQKVIFKVLIDKPFSVLMLLSSQYLFGDVEDPLDATLSPDVLMGKVSNPISAFFSTIGETLVTAPLTK